GLCRLVAAGPRAMSLRGRPMLPGRLAVAFPLRCGERTSGTHGRSDASARIANRCPWRNQRRSVGARGEGMRMPSRWWGWGLAVPLVLMGTGCTSVRMVQREGCWIKQTERWIVGTKEEMGPCARPAQALSQDPVIRAVQECVAQADYRWQARAME